MRRPAPDSPARWPAVPRRARPGPARRTGPPAGRAVPTAKSIGIACGVGTCGISPASWVHSGAGCASRAPGSACNSARASGFVRGRGLGGRHRLSRCSGRPAAAGACPNGGVSYFHVSPGVGAFGGNRSGGRPSSGGAGTSAQHSFGNGAPTNGPGCLSSPNTFGAGLLRVHRSRRSSTAGSDFVGQPSRCTVSGPSEATCRAALQVTPARCGSTVIAEMFDAVMSKASDA